MIGGLNHPKTSKSNPGNIFRDDTMLTTNEIDLDEIDDRYEELLETVTSLQKNA